MKVYLIRHTSVVWDGSVTCYGATDVDVRDTFEEEATKTLKSIEGIRVDRVYTSPLKRSVKLASFCGYPDAERDNRLKEMNFGDWEGRPWAEIIRGMEVDVFFEQYLKTPTPNGESQEDQQRRVQAFLEEKKAEGLSAIMVFCHGGVINCARSLAGEVKLAEAFATIPDFGSLTILEF